MQAVIVKIWLGEGTLAGRSQFSSWVYAVTPNEALTAIKRRMRRLALRQKLSYAWGGQHSAAVEQDVLNRLTGAALVSELAPPSREVLELAFFEDLSVQRLGERLQLTVGSVRSRLCRGRREASRRRDQA